MERNSEMTANDNIRETARRDVKNSVFIDMFNIPKYQLQLFQALHPEETDVTTDDIKLVTINSVLVNMLYNDLGLLIKDRLLIFVEAQSTWSINILIRILMYLAMTYQEYITDHGINIYSSKQADMPKPEFYVVYTGSRIFTKETISLREDFFRDPESSVELAAKVIHTGNKDDIIGQYIIFCHIIDEQVKLHGRTRKAVENAIGICSGDGVLKEYLTGRKKEVIDVMITLFSQEYAVDAYAQEVARAAETKGKEEGKQIGREEGKQIGREEGIRVTIEMCQEYGAGITETIEKIQKKFNISQRQAEEYADKYWSSGGQAD